MTAGPKAFFEIGANESAVHAFRNDWLSFYRADLGLEVIPRLAWPITGFVESCRTCHTGQP